MTASPNPPMPPADRNKSMSKGSGGGGSGGMITAVLSLLCVALAVICMVLYSGKQSMGEAKAKAESQLAAVQEQLTKQTSQMEQAARDISTLKAQVMQSVRIVDLPQAVQGSNPGEVRQKIQAMLDQGMPKGPMDGKPIVSGTTPPMSGDPATAWLERIAQQVTKQSIDTKTLAGTDAAKMDLSKGIQTVLAKIGAYSKAVSGNQKDTTDAVLAFQKANGLKADGIIGKGTWGKVREKFEQTVAHR